MKVSLLYIFLIITAFVNGQNNNHFGKKLIEAKNYCTKNNLNTEYCFLVDMSIHSGKNRFYIYNLKNNNVYASGLVCHGMGKNSTPQKPIYSNEIGSNCTSLGKYKTGKRAYSNWGINIHYKLYGLEKTNSNAFKRYVVLHSYDYVSESEIYPAHLPMGWSLGCPVVSNSLMKKIDSILKKSKKATLVWIFE